MIIKKMIVMKVIIQIVLHLLQVQCYTESI